MERSIRSRTIHALSAWPSVRESQSFNFSKDVFISRLEWKLFLPSFRSWLKAISLLLFSAPVQTTTFFSWYPLAAAPSLWSKALCWYPASQRNKQTHTHIKKKKKGREYATAHMAPYAHSHARHHIHFQGHTQAFDHKYTDTHGAKDTTQNHLINIPDKAKPYSTHLIFLLSCKINSCHCPPSRTKRLFTLTRFANKALHQDWQPPKLSASATAW